MLNNNKWYLVKRDNKSFSIGSIAAQSIGYGNWARSTQMKHFMPTMGLREEEGGGQQSRLVIMRNCLPYGLINNEKTRSVYFYGARAFHRDPVRSVRESSQQSDDDEYR